MHHDAGCQCKIAGTIPAYGQLGRYYRYRVDFCAEYDGVLGMLPEMPVSKWFELENVSPRTFCAGKGYILLLLLPINPGFSFLQTGESEVPLLLLKYLLLHTTNVIGYT